MNDVKILSKHRKNRPKGLFALVLVHCFSFIFISGSIAQQNYSSRNKQKGKEVIFNPYYVDTLINPIPLKRIYIHDKIEKELFKADLSDGRLDTFIVFHPDTSLSKKLSKSLLSDIRLLKVMVENMPAAGGRDSLMENQQKIRSLTAIWELIRNYNNDDYKDAIYYINLVANMRDMLIAANENKLMDFAIVNASIYTLDNGKIFFDEHPDVRAYLFNRLGRENPKVMMKRLSEFATDTFAGNIICADAYLEPEVIYNYATSSKTLIRNSILRANDSLVQIIVKIAYKAKAPLKVLPFIGKIWHNQTTIKEIDSLSVVPDLYFQKLTNLAVENDSIGRYLYTRELSGRALQYIRKINELHEEKDEVRFACLDSISLTDLYFIIVMGQDEIYTSSYVGTFNRLLSKMDTMTGDRLLDSLKNYHFRTFIRMAAGYNTLSKFLNTMKDTARTKMMEGFIGNLEKGNVYDLEDAVDVADAIGSIKDSSMISFLQTKIKENYELSFKVKSKKGMIIYSLLSSLIESNFNSSNDSTAYVTSSRLQLPPINYLPIKSLINDSGTIYEQVFFFGDDDGVKSYQSFMTGFRKNPKWVIDTTHYWTTISSLEGKKIVLFANMPLKEPDDEDAQNKLSNYLRDVGIHPTIIIHRGHSYHLPFTLNRLNNYVKIVVLGSCGGYHNLTAVLEHSPEAHIISSKQTGSMYINDPIITSLNNMLLEGYNVDWIGMWRQLNTTFENKPELLEKFSDYIPPYKNLGALFIKAYKRMML